MNVLAQAKRRIFPKGIRASAAKWRARLFNRTTRTSLAAALGQLRITDGSVVCLHAMLSGLGHIVGGPATVISAVRDAVPDSTLMMPTFPFDGTALDYVRTQPVYDPVSTPSRSGLLSEALRLSPGAVRGLHPSHPCVALGPAAAVLIDGSERSATPFGDDSTYGRYSARDDAVLVLIHTNNTSIVHRVQEMVGMPNLFLEDAVTLTGLTHNRAPARYQIKVHTPVLPLYVLMPGDKSGELEYVWFPDYVLLFPEYNRRRILSRLRSENARHQLLERDRHFRTQGIMKTVKYRQAELAAIRVRPWLERICRDVASGIEQFRDEYAYTKMKAALEKGLLSKSA